MEMGRGRVEQIDEERGLGDGRRVIASIVSDETDGWRGIGGGRRGRKGKRLKADLPRVNEFMDHISYEKGQIGRAHV